ncbi:MAG: hypothetical protein ACJ74Z_07990 [Bryobacteraceae bacterium]
MMRFVFPPGGMRLSTLMAPGRDKRSPVWCANSRSSSTNLTESAAPMLDPTRAVKSGATYPVKLYVCDVNTLDVSSPGVVLNAKGVSLIGGMTGTVEDAGNASPDSNFRYDATLGPSGGYFFNLKTSGLRTGTYNVHLRLPASRRLSQ